MWKIFGKKEYKIKGFWLPPDPEYYRKKKRKERLDKIIKINETK